MAIMKLDTGVITPAPPPTDKAHQDLKKATQQFESYFLDTLFKEMRKTIPKDTLVGDNSHEKDTFQEMMDQKVADSISQRGDFGISQMMYNQLSTTLPESAAPGKNTDSKSAGKSTDVPKVSVDIHR